MTTGERTFSTVGRNVVKPKQTLIPNGPYQMTLDSGAAAAKAEAWDAIPYVKVAFTVEGTALKDGGKNRKAFHQFYLSMKEGSDGVVNVDRENGLLALARACGTDFEGVEIIEQTLTNPENGDTKTAEYLNPVQVVEFLKGLEGQTVKGRIGTKPGSNGYEAKNEIKAFSKAE